MAGYGFEPGTSRNASLVLYHGATSLGKIEISGSLIWSKILMGLILIHVVNFGEVHRVQLPKSTLLTFSLVPLGSFQNF